MVFDVLNNSFCVVDHQTQYAMFTINFILILQMFLQLQGLEEEKFAILGKLLNSQMELSEVKGEAKKLKTMGAIQKAFAVLVNKTWEQCRLGFPGHSSDEVLQSFMGNYFITLYY